MRRPRLLVDGARYHVISRANRREMILERRQIKDLFLKVVKRAKERYDFRLENFCLMGNHFHFIILPARGESLSSIMQWILSVFAMAYNRLMKFTGHVWGTRFSSFIISNLREYIRLFDYIDSNPVRAHLVLDPQKWLFGGLKHYHLASREILDDPPLWSISFLPRRCRVLLPLLP
jgi:putative transposase